MGIMRLTEHIQAIKREDPAAKSSLEILLCYPGLHAVLLHRVSTWLYRRRSYVPARSFCISGGFSPASKSILAQQLGSAYSSIMAWA
jgi:serine acetyltransferase